MNAWIESALAHGLGLPGTEAGLVVMIEESTQANLRWANNALTTNGLMHGRTGQVVALASVEGGVANGCVQGPVSSADELIALVEEAARVAATGTADPDARALVDGGTDPDFDQPATLGGVEVFTDLAQGLGRAFEQAVDQHLFFGFAEHHVTTTWLGSSAATRRRGVTRMGRLELNAKHPDLIGSAWVGRASTTFADVDIDALVAEVLQRLDWCRTRIELPAGRYDVVLPGGALADLLIYQYWTMTGRDAREGSTVFAGPEGGTKVGTRLSEQPLRLASHPSAVGMEQLPFAAAPSSQAGLVSVYDNGRPTRAIDWIKDGTLAQLVETSPEQRKQGLPAEQYAWPTPNLILDGGGDQSIDELVAGVERGLLLTCLWYIREVDPQTLLLTGLTRDGVYLIEHGKVVGMVNNFRWNESPVEVLGRISAVGRTEQVLCREWNDWFTHTAMPAVTVRDFNMSTVSKAY